MSRVCRICGCSGEFEIRRAREMFYGTREAFDYFQCPGCGCLQIAEIPDDIGRFYPDNYYSKNVDYTEMVKQKRVRGFIGSLRRYLVNPEKSKPRLKDQDLSVITWLGMKQDDRILDVGCGTGRLPYIMKEAGFCNVAGADPFIDSELEYDNGLRIYKKSIEQMTDELKWDFIMFHHSFEHVAQPLEALQCAKALLSERGKLVIRIPVVGYAWEKYGVDWYQLDAPRHLYLHSKESMKLVAEKAGLVIDAIKYDSTASQFLISENYQKGIPLVQQVPAPGGIRHIREKLKKRKYKRLSKRLNRSMNGDQAAFVLSAA